MEHCQRFVDKIFDLCDGELDHIDRRGLEQHIKTCSECSRFYEEIRCLKSCLKKLTPLKASDGFHVVLRERIRREFRPGVPSGIPIWKWATAAAFVFVCSAGIIWQLNRKTGEYDLVNPQAKMPSSSSVTVNSPSKDRIDYFVEGDLHPSTASQRKQEKTAPKDTLLYRSDLKEVRSHITPVSF